ncbi:unnamed protein product [Closterium sp. NIES-65]|nr:unnamed protein product [Closterium sp. NIES-65]
MSYWGYSGCVDKVTWEVHRAVTGFARPWVTSLWGGVIADKDRPWVEEQLDCQFRSPNGSLAPPSLWYSINFFPFKSIFGLRACLDFGAAFPAQMAQMIATGRAVSSPAVLAPNGRLGFRELRELGMRCGRDGEETGKRLGRDGEETGKRRGRDWEETGKRRGRDWEETGKRRGRDGEETGKGWNEME